MNRKIRFGIIGMGSQGHAYADLLFQAGETAAGTPAAGRNSADTSAGAPAAGRNSADTSAATPAAGRNSADTSAGTPPFPAVGVLHGVLGAVATATPEKEASCRRRYPGVPVYSDWKEMAASGDVDAVIITVIHYLHPQIAVYCLERGIHVLVEKPAGIDARSVRKMNECAAAHPETAFGIMFNQRTNSLYRRIKAILDSGEMGQIRRSNWIINSWWRPDSYYRQSPWRATWGGEGGGVLVNQAAHQLDLWQWLCGTPSRVYAKCLCDGHRDIIVENDVTAVTEYPNGATGCFVTCTHDPLGTDRLEIDLDGGKIVVENGRTASVTRLCQFEQELNAVISKRAEEQGTGGIPRITGDMYETETFETEKTGSSPHAAMIENFAMHILTGEPLIAPGAEGIRGVNLANAIYLSSWLGREMENPVDEELFLAELNKKRIAAEGKYPLWQA